jgi:hypothetical protein
MRCKCNANRTRIELNGSQLMEAMWSVDRLTLTPASKSSPSWMTPSCDARRASSGRRRVTDAARLQDRPILGRGQQRMDELHV